MAQEGKLESTPVHGHGEGFPNEIILANGRHVALRLMGAADREQILTFARSLPPDDLLFLRTDITEPAIVDMAMLDPIVHHSIIVSINGESFRLKDERKAGALAFSLKRAKH
jgi:hypothetical protein